MRAFILHSPLELHRADQIAHLKGSVPFPIQSVDAIFPSQVRIPFLKKLLALAYERTGYPMVATELACLLGHRKIWKIIAATQAQPRQHFLILESDSRFTDPTLLVTKFTEITKEYDLFFWGAFDGRAKLYSSTRKKINKPYEVGTPLINSLYCGYGYSLTKETASIFLEKTKKISYPLDHYKRYFSCNEIKIGAVLPELIKSTNNGGSQTRPTFKYSLYNYCFDRVIDFKNELLTRFR
jgi:GR25 family glycosyltransferase involved in LPS biosynthesis